MSVPTADDQSGSRSRNRYAGALATSASFIENRNSVAFQRLQKTQPRNTEFTEKARMFQRTLEVRAAIPPHRRLWLHPGSRSAGKRGKSLLKTSACGWFAAGGSRDVARVRGACVWVWLRGCSYP